MNKMRDLRLTVLIRDTICRGGKLLWEQWAGGSNPLTPTLISLDLRFIPETSKNPCYNHVTIREKTEWFLGFSVIMGFQLFGMNPNGFFHVV